MNYLGIDVGFAGAITVLGDKGELIESIKMPLIECEGAMKHNYDIDTIIAIFKKYNDGNIALEAQHTRPGQGAVTQSRQMYGFGIFTGLVKCLYPDSNYIIAPQKWQNFLSKKYLDKDIEECFKQKLLNHGKIINMMSNDNFKTWYSKWICNKTTSPSKAKSVFMYYEMAKKNNNDINDIKYKDNNLVDSYLISRFCYESTYSQQTIFKKLAKRVH